MAFENVFGNIDFMAPTRSANADKANLMQLLGMGIQKKQFEQKMDMERRKMEAKEGEFNLKRTAENALMKRNMGMPTTPQEDAAIQTMGQIAPPAYSTDPFGNVIARPSGWGQLSAGSPQAGQPMRKGDTGYGQGSNPAMSMDYGDIQPAMLAPMGIEEIEAEMRPQETMPTQLAQSPMLPPTPNFDNSPVGEVKVGEAKTNIAEHAAKKSVDQMFEEEKEQREKLKGMPKQEKRIIESAYEWKGTSDVLNEALEMVTPYSAGVGSLTSVIPATPARNLAAKLNTIKADSAFGALQKMRDNSKTGGALGQVSERELSLLESAQAPLDQAQSPQQLTEALQDYQNKRTDALKRVADAFEDDYGRRSKELDALLAEMTPKRKPTPEEIRAELKRRGK